MRLFTVPLFLALASAQTTPINNLTVGTRACTGAFASLPFCDASLSREARLNDLIDRLWSNPAWIPPQLTARHNGGSSPGPLDNVSALGLPEFDFGLNCAHGVQSSCVKTPDGVTHCPTSFMNTINHGATWDDALTVAVGAVISTEARALWLAGAVEESSWSGRGHIAPE